MMTKRDILLEVRKHMTTAIMAAFGFVIALSWNDAIQTTVGDALNNLNIAGNTFYYKILAAVIVTIICVVGITIVAKIRSRKD